MNSAPRPIDPLGHEIRRWLCEADGRLGAMGATDAGSSACPRADDFGHVTIEGPCDPLPSAAPISSASASPPTQRHGIFVASGWGTRAEIG